MATAQTVYVQLLNEGTVVYRPASARELPDGRFELLKPEGYDPKDEQWEFLPGAKVTVAKKTLSDGDVLVAVSASE